MLFTNSESLTEQPQEAVSEALCGRLLDHVVGWMSKAPKLSRAEKSMLRSKDQLRFQEFKGTRTARPVQGPRALAASDRGSGSKLKDL